MTALDVKNAAIGDFASVFVNDIFLPFMKGLGIARLIFFFPVEKMDIREQRSHHKSGGREKLELAW